MESIKIDADVFAYLQKHAQPFVDTPNSTLRRLLGIDKVTVAIPTQGESASGTELGELQSKNSLASRRFKAPKADLGLLIREDFLRNGQKLYLVDYQGHRIPEFFAIISGSDLIYNTQRYSLSNLAQKLLTQIGFKSNSVRGPAHWITDEGKSIKELWRQHLDRNTR